MPRFYCPNIYIYCECRSSFCDFWSASIGRLDKNRENWGQILVCWTWRCGSNRWKLAAINMIQRKTNKKYADIQISNKEQLLNFTYLKSSAQKNSSKLLSASWKIPSKGARWLWNYSRIPLLLYNLCDYD